MKISYFFAGRAVWLLAAMGLCATLASALAQSGRSSGPAAPRAPILSGANAKLFGDNSGFTADLKMQESANPMAVTGKIAFSDGKTRFELDMIKAAGDALREQDAAQIKAMGMDAVVMLTRPDLKTTRMFYPGLGAYIETVLPEVQAESASKFKAETTQLGKETVDGHACVKNKVVVTDGKGTKAESTVWNATDLNNFPVKIVQAENGGTATLTFTNVKLTKPASASFETPGTARKYNDMASMMQIEVMQRAMRGRMGQ